MSASPSDFTDPQVPARLHEPANLVSPNAVRMWRTTSWTTFGVLLAAAAGLWFAFEPWPWWAWAAAAAVLVPELLAAVFMPPIRHRVHRWEVTDEAVHTRSGWITTQRRVAPLSRVQTVDSSQGPIQRWFKVSSVTVTTASAAGPITIDGLDQEVARQVVADLTRATAAIEGDAT